MGLLAWKAKMKIEFLFQTLMRCLMLVWELNKRVGDPSSLDPEGDANDGREPTVCCAVLPTSAGSTARERRWEAFISLALLTITCTEGQLHPTISHPLRKQHIANSHFGPATRWIQTRSPRRCQMLLTRRRWSRCDRITTSSPLPGRSCRYRADFPCVRA